MRAGHPLELLAGDVEVAQQGLQVIAEAEVAERIQCRRQPDQPRQQDHFALALIAAPVRVFMLSCSMIKTSGVR